RAWLSSRDRKQQPQLQEASSICSRKKKESGLQRSFHPSLRLRSAQRVLVSHHRRCLKATLSGQGSPCSCADATGKGGCLSYQPSNSPIPTTPVLRSAKMPKRIPRSAQSYLRFADPPTA